jgi:hypothetical protein
MINWIKNVTENFREQLAWKIFPEFGIYIEVAKLIGADVNNLKNIELLKEADSACSEWAVEIITPKQYGISDFNDMFLGENEEPPF